MRTIAATLAVVLALVFGGTAFAATHHGKRRHHHGRTGRHHKHRSGHRR